MTEERYEIRGKLGQGGLGAVYRAYDKNLNREVAIKRVLPDGEADDQDEATSSLLKEAKALSAIQHPHIVTVYDCGLDEDGPFVVMEILEGRTIEEMVGQGTLVWEDFREVVMQTQEALIAAQDLDLVHRDLKPGNIMVIWLPSGKFQIKLVDFGLAKFSPTPSLQTMDHGHAVFGSIYFMAPEQFERRPLDQRTDMYAMGAIYYYTLTGEYPFDGDTAPQVMAAHLQHKVTPLSELRPDIPDWACEWVMWHIERDMDNRPANARESLQRFLALEKQANGTNAPAGATGPQFVQPGTAAVQTTTGPNSGRVQLRTGPVAISGNTGPQVPSMSAAGQPSSANTAAIPPQVPSDDAAPGGVPALGLPALPKKSFLENKPLLVGVVGSLMALIILAAWLLNSKSEEEKSKDEVWSIIETAEAQDSLELTPSQIKLVLDFYTSDDPNWAAAAVPLNRVKGVTSDQAIAEYIVGSKISSERRKHLLDIVRLRESEKIVDIFIEASKKGQNSSLTAELLGAVTGSLKPKHTDELIKILKVSDSQRLSQLLEKQIKSLLRKSDSVGSYSSTLMNGYLSSKGSDAGKAAVYLRLASATGAEPARKILEQQLKDGDSSSKRVAIAALGGWPNDSVFPLIIKTLEDPELSDSLRRETFGSALEILKQDHDRAPEVSEKLWVELTRFAKSRGEKAALLNAISSVEGNWVTDILDVFEADPDDDISYKAELLKEKRSQ